LILVNALAFSYIHVMFNNWVVLLLTFVGGIIFTRTYLRSRSLLLATIEHAMYGLFCFYLGIGVFLLYGASS
jgi:membrane protease YdiL (CAAX protease family)